MGLGSALSTAKASLKATSDRISIISRNITNSDNTNYTHRTSYTTEAPGGIIRSFIHYDNTTPHLLTSYLGKFSRASALGTVAVGLSRLASIHSVDQFSRSPARLIASFRDSLQTYFNQYDQVGTGEAVIETAKVLTKSLNDGAAEIRKLRKELDNDIEESVENINILLKRLEDVEKNLLSATEHDEVIFSYMDERSGILKELSREIGINTHINMDGTVVVYGADGSTLFDKTARKVNFVAPPASAGKEGKMVYVDGVPLDHSSFKSPYGGGKLGGFLKMRDDIAPVYQKQLDEMSAWLFEMFKGPPALFLNGGNSDTIGLSERLSINPEFDCSEGGNHTKLGTRETIKNLIEKFTQNREYNKETCITGSYDILEFAEGSLAWIENTRKIATSDAEYAETTFMRASEALSNATGVNRDDEFALMLQLEQAYAATARIVSTVGKMMDDLMMAIR